MIESLNQKKKKLEEKNKGNKSYDYIINNIKKYIKNYKKLKNKTKITKDPQ